MCVRSPLWLAPGLAVLALFAWLLAQSPTDAAGRGYVAYGGVYVFAALLWLWAVEGCHAAAVAENQSCAGERLS